MLSYLMLVFFILSPIVIIDIIIKAIIYAKEIIQKELNSNSKTE